MKKVSKAKKSAVATPTAEEAAVIKGMLGRGDKQQWIVAWFGGQFNPGRIVEINAGKVHSGVKAVSREKLPPIGPYVGAVGVQRALAALGPVKAAIDRAVQALTVISEQDGGAK
jgi:hypothetical protein